MSDIASDVSLVFSTLTIGAQVISVVILLALIFRNSWGKKIISSVGPKAVQGALVVTVLAMVGSLLYSEVIGYEPCKFCWFQRIFMYPQVVILGIAFFRREARVMAYIFALSCIGAVIALYHYLLQLGIVETAPCSAVGYGVSCSEIFVMSYGYITIPMMALSAFVLIILLSLSHFVYFRRS